MPSPDEVDIASEGKTFSGRYSISGGKHSTLTVWYRGLSQISLIGAIPGELLVVELLQELITKHEKSDHSS